MIITSYRKVKSVTCYAVYNSVRKELQVSTSCPDDSHSRAECEYKGVKLVVEAPDIIVGELVQLYIQQIKELEEQDVSK